jgi:hypothetical protein
MCEAKGLKNPKEMSALLNDKSLHLKFLTTTVKGNLKEMESNSASAAN